MSQDAMVRTVGLTKAYGSFVALREVNLDIRQGEVFGYLGPNGSGKSTTLRVLMGLLRPTDGTAAVLDMNAWTQAVQVHRRVGYVPGELALYDRLSGREHVSYLGHLRGRPAEAAAGALADRLDLDLNQRARTLSKGNRQKLALVLALMSAPELLILDEPTGGLDPFVQQEFYAILREHTAAGGTVLLSSHVLSEVDAVADRVGVLREGRLIAVEDLPSLREKSLHHVVARFTDPVAPDVFANLPGVRDVVVDGATLHCSAPQSALDTLVKVVARYRIVDFQCAEAGLEETFMTFYGIGGGNAA
jgi:ABC-2 type transport system ATP-binding protein